MTRIYEADITNKLSGDENKGFIYIKDQVLCANIDAGSIYEALDLINSAEEALKAFQNNPNNPVFKQRAAKASLNVYKAVRLIYDDDEYEKIKKLNLKTIDLSILVESAIKLFNVREESAEKN